MDTDPAGVRAENLINKFIVYRIVLQPVGSRLCVCLCLDDVSCVPHMDTVIVSTIGRDMCAPARMLYMYTGPYMHGAPRSGTRPALFDISAPAPDICAIPAQPYGYAMHTVHRSCHHSLKHANRPVQSPSRLMQSMRSACASHAYQYVASSRPVGRVRDSLYALDADAYQPAGHASAHHGAQPVRVRDTALRPDTALGSALADGLSR